MSCCGGNRARAGLPASVSASQSETPRPQALSAAIFRYEGSGSLTVIGPATGRKYWFERAGAELAVDLRDRAAVAQVPKVTQVRIA